MAKRHSFATILHHYCSNVALALQGAFHFFCLKTTLNKYTASVLFCRKTKNITLQKERQRTGGSRNNGTTELWNHGTTDLRNKGISIFLYPLDFCPLSFVVSLRSDSEAFSTFLYLLGNEAKYLSNF